MLIIKILAVVVVLYIIITLYFLVQSYNIQKETDSLNNNQSAIIYNSFIKKQELHKNIISQIKKPKEHFNLMQCIKTIDFIQAMENFYDCEHKPCNEQVENNLKEMQKIKCKMKRRIVKLLRGKRKLV